MALVEYCHCDKKVVYSSAPEDKKKVLFLLLTDCSPPSYVTLLILQRRFRLLLREAKAYDEIRIYADEERNGLFWAVQSNPEFHDPQISYVNLGNQGTTSFETFYDEYAKYCLMEKHIPVPYVAASESVYLPLMPRAEFLQSDRMKMIVRQTDEYHFRTAVISDNGCAFWPYAIPDMCAATKKKKARSPPLTPTDADVPQSEFNTFLFEQLSQTFKRYKTEFECDPETGDIKKLKFRMNLKR